MNARAMAAAVIVAFVVAVASVAMMARGGGVSSATPMQDEAACAANDEPACARRRDRMRSSCEAKEVTACVDLADAFYTPLHAPKDDVQAAQWFDRACQLGSGRGCHMLATLEGSGRVGARDVKASQDLEEKACSLGEPKACLARAKCLEHGDAARGCPAKDLAHARALYVRACELTKSAPCEDVERVDREVSYGARPMSSSTGQ